MQSLLPYLGYAGAIVSFLWGIQQYRLKRRGEKQQIKYKVYYKVSEILNQFESHYEAIIVGYNVKEFIEIAYSMKNVKSDGDNLNTELEDIQTKIKKIKESNSSFEEELEVIKSDMEDLKINLTQYNSNYHDKEVDRIATRLSELKEKNFLVTHEIDGNDKILATLQDKLNNNRETLYYIRNSAENMKDFKAQAFKILLDTIQAMTLGFNNISDLQISASPKVIKETKVVKSKSIDFIDLVKENIYEEINNQNYLKTLKSSQFNSLKLSVNRLFILMRDEMQ